MVYCSAISSLAVRVIMLSIMNLSIYMGRCVPSNRYNVGAGNELRTRVSGTVVTLTFIWQLRRTVV